MVDELTKHMLGYASQGGMLSANDIRLLSYKDGKLYFSSLSQLLSYTYPKLVDTIIKGLLNIKSHGQSVIIPDHVIERGLTFFPENYLIENTLPNHPNLSSLTCVTLKDDFIIPTFSTLAATATKKYLLEKGASVVSLSLHKDVSLAKEFHDLVDLEHMALRRLSLSPSEQLIDAYEVPLQQELLDHALCIPALLFKALERKEHFVIALTPFPGTHATKNREQTYCYFNHEAIFALALAKQGKKVTILDLNAHFGNGLYSLCSHNENVSVLGLCVDSKVDVARYSSNDVDTLELQKQGSSIFLPAGANGEQYTAALQTLLKQVSTDQDVLLVVGGVNSYLFDSVGLLCVEAPYFSEIGKVIGKTAREKNVKKIIVTKGEGFGDNVPQLFSELCLHIQTNFGG